MMYKLLLLLCAASLFLTGCRVRDERTFTVSIPGVRTTEDQAIVRAALNPLPGIIRESIVFDSAKRTVALSYDSMQVAHKNIEIAIAEAGFSANEVPAMKK